MRERERERNPCIHFFLVLTNVKGNFWLQKEISMGNHIDFHVNGLKLVEKSAQKGSKCSEKFSERIPKSDGMVFKVIPWKEFYEILKVIS